MTPNPSSPPYPALTIARWFVAWAEAQQADLSNLKLQKLLYYAQGYWLAKTGGPLFNGPIQAWTHGPVVPEVYHHFKAFGSSDLALGDDPFDWPEVADAPTQLLIEIWEKLGSLAAWRLRDMTHDEPPWQEHFVPDVKDLEIPHDALKRHFGALLSVG